VLHFWAEVQGELRVRYGCLRIPLLIEKIQPMVKYFILS